MSTQNLPAASLDSTQVSQSLDEQNPPEEIGRIWFRSLQDAIASRDTNNVVSLFLPDGYWRDLLTLSWDYRTLHTVPTIKAFLDENDRLNSCGLSALKLEGVPALIQVNKEVSWIQCFFNFESTIARGRGFFRLVSDENGSWKAKTFYTGIEELKGYEENLGQRRPSGVDHGSLLERRSWITKRAAKKEFSGSDPEVIIVGAGQAGLCLGARLGQLRVDTLIIDKNARVGDNWRKRYDFLVLHDPVWYDHLPYIPFPSNWPVFTAKDKLGDWFEAYAASMELNIWLKSTVVSSSYNEDKHEWTVEISREGLPNRILKPKFVVLATGHSGEINLPSFKGQERFAGKICHSSQHTTGAEYRGKKAIVVGCCNSGHDVAHDFFEQGADVTLVQRSSTYVMSSKNGMKVLFTGLYDEDGPSTEDADVIFCSMPNFVNETLHQYFTKVIADLDRDMLNGLEAAGFKLDYGPNNAGFLMKYLRQGGGYYLDVGASQLIANGDIKLKQGHEISEITEDGIIFDDGAELKADIIILATGYQNMKTTAVKIFGKEGEKMNEIWGLDDEGEIKTMWRASGHPGIYAMGGNIALCRFFSKRLALKIKAQLQGLAPI